MKCLGQLHAPTNTLARRVARAHCLSAYSSSRTSNQQQRRRRGVNCRPDGQLQVACKAISSDPEANQEFCLELSPASDAELQRDQAWIADMIATWLDEEWTPLEVHQQLGAAAGAAYVSCRKQGDDDMSSLVLGLSNELLAFNYRETFVNAFEVANKVVEMLMMRGGIDVCCTSDEDAERLRRAGSTDSSTEQ